MKIIFAGSPDIAVTVLNFLMTTEDSISLVMTQPDSLGGRGKQVIESPVKIFATGKQLPLYQPTTLKTPEALDFLKSLEADLMVVVGYGKLIPPAILALPRFGCVNLHVSLLPRWRGSSPITRAILAGDTHAGVTLMQMNAGMDTGDILLQAATPIEAMDNTETLSNKVITLGLPLLKQFLADPNQILPQKQDDTKVTLAPKIAVNEARLDFHRPAVELERQVRGFYPWPIAHFFVDEERIRVFDAEVIDSTENLTPGKIHAVTKQGVDIETGQGILRLKKLQRAGGKILSAQEWFNGQKGLFKTNE